MRNRIGNILCGAFFILMGVGFAGNALEWWQFNILFDGWWTLFIIVPCIVNIVQHGFNTGSVAGLLAGVLLLIGAQPWEWVGVVNRLIFPLILIILGIFILFRRSFRTITKDVPNLNKDGLLEYFAVFSGHKVNYPAERFDGANAGAAFGGVTLNLTDAVVEKDVVIHARCVFGGIEIILPENVKLKYSSLPIFGGVSNKADIPLGVTGPTVYIDCVSVFGGVEIK